MNQPPPGPYPSPGPYRSAGPYGYDYYGYPAPRPTNGMAVASLICAFLFAPLGIVFGHISLSQIRKTGEEGRGLAVAGLVISYLIMVLGVVILVASVVLFMLLARNTNQELTRFGHLDSPGMTGSPARPAAGGLPAFAPPAGLGANCTYPATTEPASKRVNPPRPGKVPTDPATLRASIATNQGTIGLVLDNAKAPCTVNSFTSLAQQGYFDNTGCHRLTTATTLGVLQCGDPTGTGTGGPGYRFANEYPTNQYRMTDRALSRPLTYPAGTLAMANTGAGTNGSQFFLVYKDSALPPMYTVFGTIDDNGLWVLDKIAAGGVAGGGDDGKPALDVRIGSVRVG